MNSIIDSEIRRGVRNGSAAMSAHVRAMKEALTPVRLLRSNSLRIPWVSGTVVLTRLDEVFYRKERVQQYVSQVAVKCALPQPGSCDDETTTLSSSCTARNMSKTWFVQKGCLHIPYRSSFVRASVLRAVSAGGLTTMPSGRVQ